MLIQSLSLTTQPENNDDGCICMGTTDKEYPNPNLLCDELGPCGASQRCWGTLRCDGVGTCKDTGECVMRWEGREVELCVVSSFPTEWEGEKGGGELQGQEGGREE